MPPGHMAQEGCANDADAVLTPDWNPNPIEWLWSCLPSVASPLESELPEAHPEPGLAGVTVTAACATVAP